MRLFVALPVDGKIRECATRLRKANEMSHGLRWMPVDQLHITMLFLGECPVSQFSTISEQIEQISQSISPFRLEKGVFRAAPPEQEARKKMVWLQFSQNETLTRFHNALTSALQPQLDTSLQKVTAVKPHTTVARLRRGVSFPRLNLEVLKKPVWVEAQEAWMVQSRLGARGAVYRWLQRFPLYG